MKRILAALLILLAVAATACGSDAPTGGVERTISEGQDILLAAGSGDIVLQVDEGVNQPDPFPIVAAYPPFTLYGDGVIVYRDRTISRGSLPPIMRARVSSAGVQHLVGEAIAAGVFGSPDTSFDETIADGTTISVRLTTADDHADFSIGDNPELTELVNRFERDWQAIVGDEILEPPSPYAFDSLLVVGAKDRARPTADSGSGLPIDLDLVGQEYATRVVPVTCAQMTTADYQTIRAAADEVGRPHGSTWQSGDDRWYVIFRPVLPHESGCEIISNQ